MNLCEALIEAGGDMLRQKARIAELEQILSEVLTQYGMATAGWDRARLALGQESMIKVKSR